MAMSTPATARFAVRIEDTGETYRYADTRSLLEGMEALGRKGIPGATAMAAAGSARCRSATAAMPRAS